MMRKRKAQRSGRSARWALGAIRVGIMLAIRGVALRAREPSPREQNPWVSHRSGSARKPARHPAARPKMARQGIANHRGGSVSPDTVGAGRQM